MLAILVTLSSLALGSTSQDFIGSEILGRPSASTATVNAIPAVPMEVYFAVSQDLETWVPTAISSYDAEDVIEVVFTDLQPGTLYYYQMFYRLQSETEFQARPVRSFRTQPPPGSTFVFDVQADSHLQGILIDQELDRSRRLQLYHTTIQNIADDQPDLLFDLGDTFNSEFYLGGNVRSFEEALQRHYDQREFFDEVCHSCFLLLCLGNHEGEQGWRLADPNDHVGEWATQARLRVYPNPDPGSDPFYTGNLDGHENYYAFEWGNSLFVVLDPFRYTTVKPHNWPPSQPGSGNNWDWTLGDTQHSWLESTLEASQATFKFVFSHHLAGGKATGGWACYGRGGVEYVTHSLGGEGSFEWGGENLDGDWGLTQERPDWPSPIHELLRDNNVTIFFHGHDHFFAYQQLDGIVYQETPQPSDASYGCGYLWGLGYSTGVLRPNSGHLRVTVRKDDVTVDYVRAFLPGEGTNGRSSFSYDVHACSNVCGDFNRDQVTNMQDFATFAGQCYCCDLDDNGSVDLSDYATFAVSFGASQPCP